MKCQTIKVKGTGDKICNNWVSFHTHTLLLKMRAAIRSYYDMIEFIIHNENNRMSIKKLTYFRNNLFISAAVNGGWSEFGSFGECSATCGGGIKERSRTCTNPPPSGGGAQCSGSAKETMVCNVEPCDGRYLTSFKKNEVQATLEWSTNCISYEMFSCVVLLSILSVVPYFGEPVGRDKKQTTSKTTQRYCTPKRLISYLLSKSFFC